LNSEQLNWDEAFYSALQLELAEYRDQLEFRFEKQLTIEFPQLDILFVKKKRNAPITKNIAAIFRQCNVIEYKAPDDHVSVCSFYNALGYCYLYLSNHSLDITELSLTIVETGYPGEVIQYIKNSLGWEVEEREPGIHRVRGNGTGFPTQFIESQKLREDENQWIMGLREAAQRNKRQAGSG
jgi:hypothetical protein